MTEAKIGGRFYYQMGMAAMDHEEPDQEPVFRGDLIIRADAQLPGGIAEVWRLLGADPACSDFSTDLNILRIGVFNLPSTGQGEWSLGLLRNIDPADGRLALLDYSKFHETRGVRRTVSFLVKTFEYPADQVRANEIHEIQIELYDAIIGCDTEHCKLTNELRGFVTKYSRRLILRSLTNQISIKQLRRRAMQLLQAIAASPRPA